METDFIVEAGDFKGPLEVLLELIEKRKMYIHDVSLSEVADAFIEHMNNHEELPMADSADFILIASTLLLIKSKSLLPNLELTEEEKINIEDLEKRLELYKKYREASLLIKEIFGVNPLYFREESVSWRKKMILFSPTEEIVSENIFNSIQFILQNIPKQEIIPKVTIKKVISLEETIQNLSERIQKSIKMSFKDFAQKDKAEKIHIVVSFLALLELVKQGVIRASQSSHFSDIEIESESIGVPKY